MNTPIDQILQVRDQTLHRNRQHIVNVVVAIWKIVLATSFLLCFASISKPVPEVRDLFEKTQLSYSETKHLLARPGPPPFIKINETFMDCGAHESFSDHIYSVYPDETDCSAFWVRQCLEHQPSLAYVLCPGDTLYKTSDSNCYLSGTCCLPPDQVDCGTRQHLPECPNPGNLESFHMYPEVPTANWKVEVASETQTFSPFLILGIQIIATYVAFQLSYFAFETRIEVGGFAIPVTLAPILTIFFLLLLCGHWTSDSCHYQDTFPFHLFFQCGGEDFKDFLLNNWFSLLGFFSQAWISHHIWTRRTQKLAKEELVFDTPFYDALVIEQSLLLNRRMDDEADDVSPGTLERLSARSRIVGCATMWHETREEMRELLASALGMDKDSQGRGRAGEDAYTWEMHIFFDDAFLPGGDALNKYVQQLVSLLEEKGLTLEKKVSTPYGGQLIWALPEGTHMVVHLKDKQKIRAKKRWSQCMYFMYFLGTNIVERLEQLGGEEVEGLLSHAEHQLLQNTFLLALDGDVTFSPDSILKLVDLMRRDDGVGVTCGRVHPEGSGLLPSYQKFEYAVGHWLQKTTEQVLGNVLCAPGCFSLFRLSALVETRPSSHHSHLKPAVVEYNSLSTLPIHCIQYDQGEDRWLCTLLIERGWRVEYCAVSDSATACPETFSEFYNQRRRWTPSTIANLVEILRWWRPLLAQGSISVLHLVYQVLMLAGTAIGPGSIFILLVGGFQLCLGVTYWASFILNLVPMVSYILVCLFASPRQQITWAKVLSLIYGLAMIAIMFSLVLDIFGDCPWMPSTVSMELTIAAFLLVGLLHPSEASYLLHGVVYYLTIPCMYMLLPIFCVFNLDDVSWGTRDSAKKEEAPRTTMAWLRKVFSAGEEVERLEASLVKELGQLREEIKTHKSVDTQMSTGDATDGPVRPEAVWAQSLEGNLTPMDQEHEKLWTLITQDLRPITTTSEEKKDMESGLRALKTEVFLLFLFLNAAWAFGIFLMQLSSLESSAFSIDWVLCEVPPEPIIYLPLNSTAPSSAVTYTTLDPINFIFIVFFLLVLLIQVVGMLFHRVKTVGHIIATTNIFYRGRVPHLKEQFHSMDISMVSLFYSCKK